MNFRMTEAWRQCLDLLTIARISAHPRTQNNKLAAASTFPPAASNILIATSRDTPSPMISSIAESGCRDWVAAGRVGARGAPA